MTSASQNHAAQRGRLTAQPENRRRGSKPASALREDEPRRAGRAAMQLDLRGVRCPLSWAKAKIELERLLSGDELTLLLDDQKGVRDIPRAAEAAGYTVTEPPARHEGFWQFTIVV